MEDIKGFTYDRSEEAYDNAMLKWTTLWMKQLRAIKVQGLKRTYIVNMFPCEHLIKQFNVNIDFMKDPNIEDEPLLSISKEEEFNWKKHPDTYIPSMERLNTFFGYDEKDPNNIPACGNNCEIIKEFCYK